jgi:hypothetical protein
MVGVDADDCEFLRFGSVARNGQNSGKMEKRKGGDMKKKQKIQELTREQKIEVIDAALESYSRMEMEWYISMSICIAAIAKRYLQYDAGLISLETAISLIPELMQICPDSAIDAPDMPHGWFGFPDFIYEDRPPVRTLKLLELKTIITNGHETE